MEGGSAAGLGLRNYLRNDRTQLYAPALTDVILQTVGATVHLLVFLGNFQNFYNGEKLEQYRLARHYESENFNIFNLFLAKKVGREFVVQNFDNKAGFCLILSPILGQVQAKKTLWLNTEKLLQHHNLSTRCFECLIKAIKH